MKWRNWRFKFYRWTIGRALFRSFTRKPTSSVSENENVSTILVVDDEPVICKLIGLALEQEGFRVFRAENGFDAIGLSESHPGEIDLLVSDVTMPGMDGPTLAGKLREADPDIPVLFVTGLCDEALALEDNRHFVLAKPFSLDLLLRTVRRMVRARTAIPLTKLVAS
jgi:CheY-like chemotaxis protein